MEKTRQINQQKLPDTDRQYWGYQREGGWVIPKGKQGQMQGV